MTTTFKTIPGYPRYAISEDGELISFWWSSRFPEPHFIKPCMDSHTGYYKVRLNTPTGKKTVTLHSLVARAFLGERPDGYQIDHKDGNKLNNHYSNLHYVTVKENQLNPHNNGKTNAQVYADRKVAAIKNGVEQVFDNCNQLCEALGLRSSSVCMCLSPNYSAKSCHGYTFKWIQ